MTWAKIDDRANEHRKQLDAGAEACWLWACGLMYANRQPARDGFIPEKVIGMLYPFDAPATLAASLVKVGLWKKAAGGWKIHEFQKWNQTREQAEAEKEKGRERAAKSYESRKAKKSDSSGEEKPKTPSEDEPKDSNSSPPRVQTGAGIPSDSAASAAPLPLQAPENNHNPRGGRPGDLPCPKDLALTPDQRGTLESSMIPGWAIDVLTAKFIANNQAAPDDLRPLVAWRKCLSQAICSWWNRDGGRMKKPGSDVVKTDETGGYGNAAEWVT